MFELPFILVFIISIVSKILICLVFFSLIYYTVLSIFGLKKPSRNYVLVEDEYTFLFIVPAHNEELVIEDTLVGLSKQNYSKELYSCVCIADNCKDNTVSIIQKKTEVELFENYSTELDPRGKPHAIAAYLESGNKIWKEYDYVVFIDADNYVDPNFLTEMNSQLVSSPNLTVIQGYLGSKNVFSSIVSTGYAAVYYITNRAVQYAKSRLNWNASIGGTGFVLSTDYLVTNGWNPRSYTEDFELQVELAIKGEHSTWNHFAKVYDEKPNDMKSSYFQRKRWAQGHWYVGITQTINQIKAICQSRNLREGLNRVETLLYSYSMLRPVAFTIIGLFIFIDVRTIKYFPGLFSLLPFWFVLEIFNFLIIPVVFCLQEAKEDFNSQKKLIEKILFMVRLLVGFIVNTLTYSIIQVIGFCTWFYPQNKWVKTNHGMSIDTHRIEKDDIK